MNFFLSTELTNFQSGEPKTVLLVSVGPMTILREMRETASRLRCYWRRDWSQRYGERCATWVKKIGGEAPIYITSIECALPSSRGFETWHGKRKLSKWKTQPKPQSRCHRPFDRSYTEMSWLPSTPALKYLRLYLKIRKKKKNLNETASTVYDHGTATDCCRFDNVVAY